MEKEQKKLLLVAISVGVFLLVTITVAIVLLGQRNQPQEAAITWTNINPVQPAVVQPLNPPVADNPQNINVNVDCEDSDVIVAIDRNEGDKLIIQIPNPTITVVPDTPKAVEPERKPASPVVAAAPAKPASPAPAAAPASQTRRQPAATSSGSAGRTTTARTINDYWVQIGAYSAKIRAEDAKEILAEKGFISIIENREINGQVLYRVRLGPYATQREADYWLALVKNIDGFGDSQVRQTTRTQ